MRTFSVLAFALLAATGCGTAGAAAPGGACTEMGARVGIAVDVAAPLAAKARHATLEVCWNGTCQTKRVELFPATRAGDTTCAGDQPGDVCSAPAHVTGGRHGFADLPDLPELPVSAAFTLTGSDGGTITEQRVEITPKLVYPNGPDCPPGGPQAGLVVDSRGVVHES